jgi:mannitol-1-phosphate 5-dehydrogenase
MRAVHFGAGNIGRGFIGQLLHQSNYSLCFVDVNQELVQAIQDQKSYSIVIADDSHETVRVTNIQAVDGNDLEAVAREIAAADLVTTAIGPSILKHIAPVIAQGIAKRLENNPVPLNIIACENMIGGSSQLKALVLPLLSDSQREAAAELIGFPDSAVDRIVPLQHHEDKLTVTVERFFEWIVDESQIVGARPVIEGALFVPDLQPFIERKLFTVNTGHAAAAYLGYYFGYPMIDQAMADPYIYESVKQALEETGQLLTTKFDFDKVQHEQYITKILQRFSNAYLPDEVTRVGRSPIRKLSPNDRLSGPALQAFEHGIQPKGLARAIAAALAFNYGADTESAELQSLIQQRGIDQAIRTYTLLEDHHPVFLMIKQSLAELTARKSSILKGSD